MDLLDAQNTLKQLPDERLAQEARQPTGVAPQFMVLSELQRRQTMRNEYQAQRNPQTTVAEKTIHQAGIGGLQGFKKGGSVGRRLEKNPMNFLSPAMALGTVASTVSNPLQYLSPIAGLGSLLGMKHGGPVKGYRDGRRVLAEVPLADYGPSSNKNAGLVGQPRPPLQFRESALQGATDAELSTLAAQVPPGDPLYDAVMREMTRRGGRVAGSRVEEGIAPPPPIQASAPVEPSIGAGIPPSMSEGTVNRNVPEVTFPQDHNLTAPEAPASDNTGGLIDEWRGVYDNPPWYSPEVLANTKDSLLQAWGDFKESWNTPAQGAHISERSQPAVQKSLPTIYDPYAIPSERNRLDPRIGGAGMDFPPTPAPLPEVPATQVDPADIPQPAAQVAASTIPGGIARPRQKPPAPPTPDVVAAVEGGLPRRSLEDIFGGLGSLLPDRYSGVEARMAEMQKNMDDQAGRDGWAALAKAGLHMASNPSPRLIPALGKAGIVALDDMRESKSLREQKLAQLMAADASLAGARTAQDAARLGAAGDIFASDRDYELGLRAADAEEARNATLARQVDAQIADAMRPAANVEYAQWLIGEFGRDRAMAMLSKASRHGDPLAFKLFEAMITSDALMAGGDKTFAEAMNMALSLSMQGADVMGGARVTTTTEEELRGG